MNIAILLSGGVDSSVALALLKEQGYNLTAYYLKIWLEDDMAFMGNCPWEEDLFYATEVCQKLDVPLKTIDLQKEYYDLIVSYTISELKMGRTPSPDVLCNRNIKFGKFIEKIDNSFDKIASGHYADIIEINGKYYLKQSPDKIKDQTYFLNYLTQEQLKRLVFPIGKLNKKKVRELANKYDLPTKNRKDSQGICFLGKIKYSEFVWYHFGEKNGEIIDINNGKVLGYHKGYWYYTIGQRQGMGLGAGPWYVVRKDIEKNQIFVSNDKNQIPVVRDKFKLSNINWIPEKPDKTSFEVKLRHGPKKYICNIEWIDELSLIVKLNENDQGIAPGQFAVLYDGDYCIGGGIIDIL